jgi:hypothetical protein
MVVAVYEKDLRLACVCDGPDNAGRCPIVTEGAVVPCAGKDIVLSKDEFQTPPEGLERPHFAVPARLAVCPFS